MFRRPCITCLCLLALLLAGSLSVSVMAANTPGDTMATGEHQQFLFAFRLLQRGDDALAQEAFETYLQQYPDGPKRGDALYYLATLHRKAGRHDVAWNAARQAGVPSVLPGHALPLLRAQLLVDRGQHAEALAELEALELSGLAPTVAAPVMYLRAACYRAMNNPTAAAQWFEQAAEQESPLQAQALLELARTQVALDRVTQARTTLQKLLASTPPPTVAAAATRLAGDLAYQQQDYAGAQAFYEIFIASHQSDSAFATVWISLFWTLFERNELATMQRLLDTPVRSLSPAVLAQSQYILGAAYLRNGEPEKALAAFDAAQRGDGRATWIPALLLARANAQFALGQMDAARGTLAQLTREHPQAPQLVDAALLLARHTEDDGQRRQAIALLGEQVDREQSAQARHRALLARARLHRDLGQFEQAAADYQRFLDQSPYDRRSDDQGQTRFVPDEVQSQIFLDLLDALYRAQAFDQVRSLVDQWLHIMRLQDAVIHEALYRRALARMRQGDLDAAMQELAELNQAHPDHAMRREADYYQGLAAIRAGRTTDGLRLLGDVADRDDLAQALRINAHRVLSLQYQANNEPALAVVHLQRLEALAGGEALTSAQRHYMARELLKAGQPQAALEAARHLLQRTPDDQDLAQQTQLRLLVGQALYELERYAQARDVFEVVAQSLQQRPAAEARLWLGRIHLANGEYEAAIERLTPLINLEDPALASQALFDAAGAHRMLARRADELGQAAQARHLREQALRLYKRLVLLYPFEALSPLPQMSLIYLAQVQQALGQPDDTLASYEELIVKFPDSPHADYARARLAMLRRQKDQAARHLQTLAGVALDKELAACVQNLQRELNP